MTRFPTLMRLVFFDVILFQRRTTTITNEENHCAENFESSIAMVLEKKKLHVDMNSVRILSSGLNVAIPEVNTPTIQIFENIVYLRRGGECII